jgi:hypothetical protein
MEAHAKTARQAALPIHLIIIEYYFLSLSVSQYFPVLIRCKDKRALSTSASPASAEARRFKYSVNPARASSQRWAAIAQFAFSSSKSVN